MLTTTKNQALLTHSNGVFNANSSDCTNALFKLFQAGHVALLDELKNKSSRRLRQSSPMEQVYSLGGLFAALGGKYARARISESLKFLTQQGLITYRQHDACFLAVLFRDDSLSDIAN